MPMHARFLCGCLFFCLLLLYRAEQLKAKRQESGTPSVGEEGEVPNANEAFGSTCNRKRRRNLSSDRVVNSCSSL